MRIESLAVTATLSAALLAGPSHAVAQDFSWRGRLTAGRTLEVKGVSGDVNASFASGDEIRVTARKTARRSDPDSVEIVVLEHSAGVTICAVYPSRPNREPNECRAGSGGRNNTSNNDVKVEFSVEVPRGVAFVGRTVNGSISAISLQSDIDLSTVNGSIEASTTGLAKATTVNGSIEVAMGRADWSGDLDFETVNGGITVSIGQDINTEVSATTVNGSISSDFPLLVRGRFGPKRLNGTVGNAGSGRSLSMTTVNGDIQLRRF